MIYSISSRVCSTASKHWHVSIPHLYHVLRQLTGRTKSSAGKVVRDSLVLRNGNISAKHDVQTSYSLTT